MSPKSNNRKTYGIEFWLMIFGLFTFTIGQFIPIYFVEQDIRIFFYPAILLITVVTFAVTVYKSMYLPHKNNWVYSSIITLITTLLLFLIFAGITFGKILTVWTDATTLYVKKDNSQVKIVTRYINEGAFGGGTEPGDYEIVLLRPITPFFKMETTVDKNKIDRSEWVKK
jgi:hypothetical protein